MQISHILHAIEDKFPLAYQESWDNSGLQTGSRLDQCEAVLVSVDVTEATVDEASRLGCNLIIAHHPLFFKGVKRLTGDTVQQRAAMAAIKKGISIYSCHTPADNMLDGGVSGVMAELLGLNTVRVLSTTDTNRCLTKIYDKHNNTLRLGLDELISDFPRADRVYMREYDDHIEISAPSRVTGAITMRVSDICLVEMPMIEITRLLDKTEGIGLGAYGVYDRPVKPTELISRVKEAFHATHARVTGALPPDTGISRVALCGGAGAEFIPQAIASGAQAYITSDIKYHDFLDYGNDIMLIDIGHFEAESVTKQIFYNTIKEKFPTFAVYKSETEANPFRYL